MKISHKMIVLCFLGCISNASFADIATLQKQESKVIQQFQKSNFYEVNTDIEQAVVRLIANDPSSFKHNFAQLEKQGYVHIQYSPDKKLKFYSFDVSGGGTMGEWSNYVQYATAKTQHLDEFESGYINQIQPVRVQNKNVYLVRSYYKGDSCTGVHHLRAVEIGPKQLLKSYVFNTKQKNLHEISVDYDCRYDQERNNQQNYIKVAAKQVDVMLLNQKLQPQHRYLRYSLGSKGFVYQGIVK